MIPTSLISFFRLNSIPSALKHCCISCINTDLPKSKETYVHRIGRSGRYGRKGVAINFITNRELGYLNELEEHYNIKIDDLPQNVGDIFNV